MSGIDDAIPRWRSLLRDALARDGAPGCAVVLVMPDDRHVICEGRHRADATTSIGPDTLFGIGSLSKAFCATALALLADRGRLRLDDRVTKWLPDYAPRASHMRDLASVKDLLAGRTGLSLWDEIPLRLVTDDMRAMTRMAARLPAREGFRDQHCYSNAMLTTAGVVLETLVGSSWDEAVAQLLLDPLGMERTTARASVIAADGDRADHHLLREGRMTPLAWDVYGREAGGPSGGLYSTASDLGRWIEWQLGHARLPSGWEPTVCHRPAIVPGAAEAPDWASVAQRHHVRAIPMGYGLGWHVHLYRGERLVHHSGGSGGYCAWAGFAPDRGVGAAVLLNGRSGGYLNHAVGLSAIDLLMGGGPAIDWPSELAALPRPASILGKPLDRNLAGAAEPQIASPERFVGTYANDILDGGFHIWLEMGQLFARSGRMVGRLLPIDPDRLELVVTDRLEHPFCDILAFDRPDAEGRPMRAEAERTRIFQQLVRQS